MKLYGYYRSSAAFRVRIALNIKGLELDQIFVHLREGDQRSEKYLGVNPQGLVPALEIDDGQIITQSMVIIEYLEEAFPNKISLLPKDIHGRARVRSLSSAIACDIHPLNNLRVLNFISQNVDNGKSIANDKWYKHWIREGMKGVQALLTNSPDTGEFCHGNSPSIADCCLIPQIYNAERFGCDMTDYPVSMRINSTCLSLNVFRQAMPEEQADFEK